MPNLTTIPNVLVDLIDPRTGKIARPWYMFFENIWKTQGGGGTGGTGPMGPSMLSDAEQGEQGDMGQQGIQGIQGAQGIAVFLEADAGEDGMMGPQGTQGFQGEPGMQGPIVFLEGDDVFDDVISVPYIRASNFITQTFTAQTSIVVTHNFRAYPVVTVMKGTSVIIPLSITHSSTSAFTVTFSVNTTGTIIASVGNL